MFSKSKCLLACWSLMFLGATNVLAQEKKIPNAKQILATYIKALGGEEKIATIQAVQYDAKMTIAGAGVGGTLSVISTTEGKFRQSIEIDGLGSDVSGSDGTIVWTTSAITGSKVLEGTLAEQIKLRAAMFPLSEYANYFETMECTSVEKFDAVDCYVVKSSKPNWKPVLDYFEISTGLHRGTRETIATEQGELQVETTYQDYRDVDGIKMSYVSVQKLGPQALEIQVTSFKVNPKLASDVFEVPEEVKALKK